MAAGTANQTATNGTAHPLNAEKSNENDSKDAKMNSGKMYDWRVKSIYDALSRQGVPEGGSVSVEQLTALGHLDQYHYLGTHRSFCFCSSRARALAYSHMHRSIHIYTYTVGGIGGRDR